MFDSTLTLETALQRMGEPLIDPEIANLEEYILDKDNPVVLALKEGREIESREGYSSRERKRAGWKLQSAFYHQGILRSELLIKNISYYQMESELFGTFNRVIEAIMNAIEHGSDYGNKGPVKVALHRGKNALAAIVEDPGEGIDFTKITIPKKEELSKMERSKGLPVVYYDSCVKVGFERFSEGFRVIVMYDAKS
ncbi:MAG: ATP-binding protein [Candidatus Woesearchaeota archaeon]